MEPLLGYLVMAALWWSAPAQTPDGRTSTLLQQARVALGGDAAVQKVRALSAVGTVRRAAGSAQMAGDLTLQFELPDRMLRTDSLSPDGGITLVSEQGFSGNTLLRSNRIFNAPPGAMIRTPPPPQKGSDAEAQAVRAAQADLARLTIALLLRAPQSMPLDFAYGGTAEAPDGKADVIDVKGRDGSTFAAQLFLDTATHRPLMLSYRGVAPRLVVQTQRAEPGSAQPRGTAPPPLPAGDVVDIALFLDDYRKVDGLLLPHHITRSIGGEVAEEWTFNTFAVNPTFKPGTFDAK